MDRRRLLLANSHANEESGGFSAVLTPNQTTEDNKRAYDYMLANGVWDGVASIDWFPKETDNIVVTGSYDGVLLDNVRVTHGWLESHDGTIKFSMFYLYWPSQDPSDICELYPNGYFFAERDD